MKTDYLSVRSLAFLRPIYRHLRRGGLVLFRVSYSGQGGNTRIFVLELEHQLIPWIRELPKKAIVRWWSIDEPDWKQELAGLVPTGKELITGAY